MTKLNRRQLAAAAFRDAMRHILAEDGVFMLADHEDPRRVWSWNGLGWREERLSGERISAEELHVAE